MSAGKGDEPRPLSVSREEYARRWELTFGKRCELHDRVKPCLPCRIEAEAPSEVRIGGVTWSLR